MARRSRFQGSQNPNSRSYREPTKITSRPMDPRDPGNRNFNYIFDDNFSVGARDLLNRLRLRDFVPSRPAVGYEQPGVNFREALEGKTSKQGKPTITSEKSKAFGDLLKRMKRF